MIIKKKWKNGLYNGLLKMTFFLCLTLQKKVVYLMSISEFFTMC